jgi:8-oxo-dGTP pyrophosphatase MutT (NUDIX family)
METKHDFSYGVIPVYRTDGDSKVLLVHQRSHRGEQFWTFPKGHAEAGESTHVTALRELREETGITDIQLVPGVQFVTEYTFVHEGVKIIKRVEFFLGYVNDTKVMITQPEEIVDLAWLDFTTAAERLSHQNTRQILKEVTDFLTT